MFKYELGQTVYYMFENRIHSAVISRRSYVDTIIKDENIKEIKYSLAEKWYYESSVYRTVDDLCYFLKMNLKTN